MSRKNQLNYVLEDAKSLAASFVTEATLVPLLDNLSYQVNVTTASSQGIFTVQASNDYDISIPGTAVQDSGNWFDLVLSGVPIINAANDVIAVSLNQVPFKAVRLKYTSIVAGTGTCKIIIQDKMI